MKTEKISERLKLIAKEVECLRLMPELSDPEYYQELETLQLEILHVAGKFANSYDNDIEYEVI